MPSDPWSGVSRETQDRLELYEALVRKWTKHVNLVSASTLDDLRARHIVDSLQLLRLVPHSARTWVDLGSGGGFPGLVIALSDLDLDVTLVESDARKCAFLLTVLRESGVCAAVLNKRIEDLPPLGADVVSARALAPLTKLIELANPHLNEGGTLLAPKGENYASEIESALENWSFHCEKYDSLTSSSSAILGITQIERI